MRERIFAALEVFRVGEDDKALGSLLEVSEKMLPGLLEVYRSEADPECRAFLVRVAWERAEDETVQFIAEALNDPAEEVWQSALDGTVALASPEMIEVLKSVSSSKRADAESGRRFQLCVDEAIVYIDGLIQGGQRPGTDFVPPAFKK